MQLRPYQTEIAQRASQLLRNFSIAYLCMEVRCGKTLTSFEAARLYGAKKVLFVTKLKAISSIQQDFEGSGKHFSLYVTNYESLHKVEKGWDLVIIDEAHSLGQYPVASGRAKEMKRICEALPIIYLSGTPTPESFSQMYYQLWVSSFGPWKGYPSFYKWHKDHGIPKVKYLYNRQIADYSATKDIQPQYNHLMITYTQEEAGFEMPVEEEVLKVPMSEHIKWAVGKLRKDKLFRTQAGDVILADTAVKEMQKVHQCCSGTVKTEDGNAIVFDWTKANYVKEKFNGQKIAIFYKYVAEEMQLRAMFNPKVTTDPVEFNASEDMVFISQVQSGREGINLSTADCLVMYNIDFSALSYWQARARLQTRDRVKPAKVYWIFTDGGIEEKIYAVVQGKKDFTLSHYRRLK